MVAKRSCNRLSHISLEIAYEKASFWGVSVAKITKNQTHTLSLVHNETSKHVKTNPSHACNSYDEVRFSQNKE